MTEKTVPDLEINIPEQQNADNLGEYDSLIVEDNDTETEDESLDIPLSDDSEVDESVLTSKISLEQKGDVEDNDETTMEKTLGYTMSNAYISPPESDAESDDEENTLQKLDSKFREEFIEKFHMECIIKNFEEVEELTRKDHITLPFITKYEKTKILGQRAKQINSGHKSYIDVPHSIIDGYLIAELEFKEKKIPFIIRRPIPNGTSDYWKLSDLEII